MTAQKRSELRRQRHRAGSSEAEKLHKSARQGVFAALTIFALAAGARAEEPSPGAHCGGKTSKEWARVVADHKGTDKSKTPQQVTRALLALERIGADGPDAIPILGEVMKSAAYPGATHRAVADLLALHTSDRHSNEKATAALTAALLSGVESSRDAVFMSRVWRHDPVPPELIAAAAKLLSDEKNLVAAGAARSLESAGRSALSALAELRKALSRDFTRDEAARTLVAIGNPALVALPDMDAELARLVKVENEAKGSKKATESRAEQKKLREQRDKLAALEKHKGRTLAEWVKAVGSKTPADRIEALGALDALRPETSVRVEAATKLLKDPERDVRKAAFLALRRFKADARRLHPPAAMALVDYVDSQGDTDGINFQDLTDALAEVAGADAVPVLVRLAKSGDDWGAHGLGRVGPGALPAAELLASLMAGEKNRILMREWAAEAFVKLGPLDAATADKVVPDLLVALRAQGDGVEAGRIRGRALEGLLACAALPATVEKTVSEMIPGLTGDERGPWRRDLVQLLAERFPKSAAPFKETLLEVKETPRGAALLAELDPETPGLVVWVMDRLKVDAERIDVEGKSKCTHNPTEMAWLLRAARAFKKAPPFQLATERALWASDAATRDAARKTLAEMR